MKKIVAAGLTCLILITCAGACAAQAGKRPGSVDYTLMIKAGGLDRHYLAHVPNGAGEGKAVPVVMMFHGAGGSGRGAMRETGWAQKADKEGFIAVFPDAMPPDPTQPAKFGTNNQIWNDGSGRGVSGEKNIPDVAFINAMLDDIAARFSVDSRRIYATGFSNGASMTFRVGVELSTRIAAVAPVSGSLWIDRPKLDKPVSLYYITGDSDPLNPLDGGTPKFATGREIEADMSRSKVPVSAMISTWARALGCRTEPQQEAAGKGLTTLIYSGGPQGSEVRFTTVIGQGHIWPGGLSYLPKALIGNATDSLKATDAIWEFFMAHPQPQ